MGTNERRLFEYFIIAGLKNGAHELAPLAHDGGNSMAEQVAPITDICVIFPGIGETVPEGFECIETTPLGHAADLNHGSLRAHSAFLCYRRGYHKPPLVDLGILDDGRGEKPMTDSTIIERTPFGHSANVNNTSHGLYFTTRRSPVHGPPHQLVITHICVILANKGEVPPHTYYKIDKNLNKGMVGSDVYVCYKKSQMCGKKIAYKPEVLDCFPVVESVDDSLTQNVPMFCLPMGALIESWSEQCREAEKLFSTCVLTDETGTKYYGASLTFYEKYEKELTDAQLELLELRTANDVHDTADEEDAEKASYHCNKSICIVSRYPFFESFRRFLFFVYGVSLSGPFKLPIERYISYLMYEVPFPSPERPRVLVQLANDMISFESHDDSQIPLSGATFVDSLKNLGTENFMYAMLLALLEQKILVHSLRPWLLTSVAETICALMFPFHWQCPYIPQCPLALAGVLHAPLPFITGVDSRYFDLYDEPPSDVTCFDLDTATVSHSSMRKSLKLSILPKKPLKKLRASLDAVLRQMNDDIKVSRSVNNGFEQNQVQNRKSIWEIAIREAFLRFMCSLMTGYARHLQPIMKSPREKNATDTGALFNLDAFIRSRDKNALDFYQRFSETQCFIRFIEERCFVSDKNAYNVFFDDCIQRVIHEKITKTEVRLLDNDALTSNHTIVIPSPEVHRRSGEGSPADLTPSAEKFYRYDHFPEKFDHALFETERILKCNEANSRCSTPFSVDSDKMKYWLVRTKQESKTSFSEAERFIEENPHCWPNTMLFYAYSLWFLQLPSMISISRNKLKILKLAFKILCRMERSNIPFHDQVCYRILIYLCGEYGRPAMATQVLLKMRRMGVQLNAVTYGIYHWALMQGDWPTDARLNAIDAWRRVRLRVEACALFKEYARLSQQQAQHHQSAMTANNSSSAPYDDSSLANEESSDIEESPTRSLQALSVSNNSLYPPLAPHAAVSTSAPMTMEEQEKSDIKFSLAVLPLEENDSNQVDINYNQVNNELDPLGVAKQYDKGGDADVSLLTAKQAIPSVYLSPSRQKFMREQTSTPFLEDSVSSASKASLERRKKSLKMSSSWLKGFTNSPIVSRFIGVPLNDSVSMDGSIKSESMSGMSISPSLSSIVHQVRKQALKGYDEVVQQGNVLLKRSGINNLVTEAKNLNKSYGARDASTSGVGANDATGSGALFSGSANFFSDASFQLDSGINGDILGAEFWMREILPQNISEMKKMWLKSMPNSFIDVSLCSASKCSKCELVIYDEELVAGWTVESSNLNTICPSCGHSFLPSLKVTIRRKENELSSSWYVPLSISITDNDEDEAAVVDENAEDKPSNDFFTVTFVSPLILRRELESLLLSNPLVLADVSLRVTHPVIFWNLLYYCRRLDVPTHMLTWVASHVHIRCVYDVPSLHAEAESPVYFANHQDSLPSLVTVPRVNVILWQHIVDNLQQSNLFLILKYLINEHREKKETAVGLRKHFSFYREVFFVALDKFNRSVDREQFDRQFQQELEKLPPRILPLLSVQDIPPKAVAIACRRIFMPLDVV